MVAPPALTHDGTRKNQDALSRAVPYVEYDEVQAVCSDCGRAFPSDESLMEHRRDAHAGLDAPDRPATRRVACSLCTATFRSTAALQEHNRRAHTS